MLAGWTFGALTGRFRAPGARGGRRVLALAFLLVTAGPTVFLRRQTPHLYLGQLPEYLRHPPGAVTEALAREARPGERVAIWGWRAGAWVQTQTRMGTREAEAEFQILPGPLLDYYRTRYLADLKRNQPALFLDAVCPTAAVFKDRAAFGFEIFPEPAQLIARDYTLRVEVEGARIYRLNASLAPLPTSEPTPPAP